ncbi:MAG: ATP-binding protein, partial [Bdellovibrionota bacterium]
METFDLRPPKLDVTRNSRRFAGTLFWFCIFYGLADLALGQFALAGVVFVAAFFHGLFLWLIERKGTADFWVRIGIVAVPSAAVGVAAHMVDAPNAILVWLWPLAVTSGFLFDRNERQSLVVLLGLQMSVLISNTLLPPGSFFKTIEFPSSLALLSIQGSLVATFVLAWTSRSAYLLSIAEVEKKNQELLYASKMSMLGQMSAGICHEIKNPLSVVVGKVQSLSTKVTRQLDGGTPLDLDVLSIELDRIGIAAQRIQKTVEATRNFSRTVTNDSSNRIAPETLFSDVLEIARERLHLAGVQARVVCDSHELELVCRVAQIEQVLLNLVINAVDAVENLPKDQRWIELRAIKVGSRVELWVTDGGAGLPPETAARVWDPFFTTKE